MSRTIWANGTVFDGTGADVSVADIAVERGRIVDIGVGLDGDESVDLSGHLVTPGRFDCHVHFMIDGDLSPTTHAALDALLPRGRAHAAHARHGHHDSSRCKRVRSGCEGSAGEGPEVGEIADLVAFTGTDVDVTDLKTGLARVVQAG